MPYKGLEPPRLPSWCFPLSGAVCASLRASIALWGFIGCAGKIKGDICHFLPRRIKQNPLSRHIRGMKEKPTISDVLAFLSDRDAMETALLYHLLPEDKRYGIRVIARQEFMKLYREETEGAEND